jgi:uncharacterized protein YjiS (DUF1127 family)
VHNPNALDRMLARLRRSVIGWLQSRRDRARLVWAPAAEPAE